MLVAVFVGALSMDMERFGWGFLVLCFLVGSLGSWGYFWVRERLLLHWDRLPKPKRRIAIASVLALILVGIFFANRHKPDEATADVMACLGVVCVLLLWGLYRIMSRFLDALHARLSGR